MFLLKIEIKSTILLAFGKEVMEKKRNIALKIIKSFQHHQQFFFTINKRMPC